MSKEVEMVQDVQERVGQINDRISEIQNAIANATAENPVDTVALMEEFKTLMAEAAELNKKTTAKKSGGTRARRESKVGVLKGAKTRFQPRNTAIDLDGEINGISVDKRNGSYLAQITHVTGMKFTKKIDQVELIDATPKQEEYLAQLVAEQAELTEQVKEAKAEAAEAKEAEAEAEAESMEEYNG